jgi:transforming growth factor-beta-induced protein
MKKTFMAIVGIGAASLLAAPLTASAQEADPSIAAIAVDNGLDTLVAAVTAAGLDGTLADCDAGPFTVFAPTEEAFAALPEETLNAALADPTGLLTTVLTYHVVPGVLDSTAVVGSTSLTTLQGEDISVASTVLNGSSNIVVTDVAACNGIVHVIDAVLLPPSVAGPAPELAATGVNSTTYVLLAAAGALMLAGFGLTLARRHDA